MNRIVFCLAGLLSALMPLVFDSTLKGAALLALAAVVALALHNASAATRHLVWLIAIGALLIVPVLSFALPRWRVLPNWTTVPLADTKLPPPVVAAAPGREPRPPFDEVPAPPGGNPSMASLSPRSASAVPPARATTSRAVRLTSDEELLAWRDWLPITWCAGFTLLALRLLAAHLMLRHASRHCSALTSSLDKKIAAAFEEACQQLGLRQRVTLLLDQRRTIPLVWGVFRPRLMLPIESREWGREQVRSVLLHELAHIKRRDTFVQWLTQVACAMHWWNPLVWLAAWRLHAERERACDDLVLASGVRPSTYAEHLLNVATKLSPARWTAACGLAMARKSSLEGRLLAVLSQKQNRGGITRALTAAALILGTVIAIPLAMLQAADDKWNPPSGVHVGGNDFSTFCVHDGKDATFVIAYHGDFNSTSRSSSNAKARTWNNDVTLTAKKPGIALRFHRTHTAPGKLSIAVTPAEGLEPSKPAPPPDSWQKEYDLAKGRVFLLTDSGLVRQFDLPTPVVTDRESSKKLAALITAIPPQEREDIAFARKPAGKLAPETIAKLKWGEPVNGLRMALAYPPALKDALLGDKPHFELVVQNVSEKAVRLTTGDAAPNPRRLTLQDATPVARTVDDVPIPGDWLLQPHEVVFVRLFHSEQKFEDGKTLSAMEEHIVSVQPQYSYMADMTIGKAPAGAWTGKLVTGATRCSADKADAPAPIHKDARALYESWQRLARAKGDIPGALLGELAAAVKLFIKYNPTWENVPKLNEILPRLDAARDWKAADVIALLDEMGAIKDAPLDMASWKQRPLRKGEKLPEKFADAEWSGGKTGGLRVAWMLEPGAAEHRIGTALKARLLVWNTGAVPVMLQVPTWHQGGVTATDAKGAEVQVSGIEWTTLPFSQPARLGPGELIEINAPGVGLGKDAGRGPWAGPRVGSNVFAKPGDDITLTHSPVPLDGSEEGIRDGVPPVVGAGWWMKHIKTRLSRELPLPAGAAERTHLLERAVRELFAAAPTAEEIAAFTADQTPDALDALANRLAERPDAVEFAGKLSPAPVKFRVLAADPAAGKTPRVVLGPGGYPIGEGTASLKIVGRPVGDRSTNDAQLVFVSKEPGIPRASTHKLELPDGWGTWAIVCRPGEGFFYILHKGTVRKIDYTKPRQVTDTPATDLPVEFRDEVKRQLDIHEVSAESQAEIFEKPATPAVTPQPKSAAAPAKLTPAMLDGFWSNGGLRRKEMVAVSFDRDGMRESADVSIGSGGIGIITSIELNAEGTVANLKPRTGAVGRFSAGENGALVFEIAEWGDEPAAPNPARASRFDVHVHRRGVAGRRMS